MTSFNVVVATAPSTSGELLSHDLNVLKPILLYADHVTLLSPVALLGFGIAAEVSVEDPRQRAAMIVQLADTVPNVDLPPETLEALTGISAVGNLAAGNRKQRRALNRKLGSHLGKITKMAKQLDELWSRLQEVVYKSLIQGKPAEQLADAVEVGLLDVDPLNYGSQQFDTDETLHAWLQRVMAALKDPHQFVLFDQHVAHLVRAKMKVDDLQLDDLGRTHSRQLGLASGFIAQLPTLDAASVSEIIDFRYKVIDAIMSYRSEISHMALELDSDLHDEDFGAWVRDRWINEVEPALAHIEREARSAGLIRTTVEVVGQSAERLAGLTTAALTVDKVVELPEAVIATAAGAGAKLVRDIAVSHRAAHANLRGQRFILLHDVKHRL